MEDKTKLIDDMENIKLTKGKHKFILRNLSDEDRDILLTSGAAIGGAGLASLLASSMKFDPDDVDNDEILNNDDNQSEDYEESTSVVIYTDAPFSDLDLDDKSFADAFAEAREEVGPGGFFEWRGDVYNTYYKEEWEAMSPEQQHDFMESVVENTHFDDAHPWTEEEIITVVDELPEDDGDLIDKTPDESMLVIEEEIVVEEDPSNENEGDVNGEEDNGYEEDWNQEDHENIIDDDYDGTDIDDISNDDF